MQGIRSALTSLLRKAGRRLYEPLRVPFGDAFWYAGPNLWEPSVALALRDLCVPGAVVFDVGANFGGVTSLMCRLVGPRGIVCSFEASPRIFGQLQNNIVVQGHTNATAYHCAVYSRSHELINVYVGDHLMSDSIFAPAHDTSHAHFTVGTLALDDFVAATELIPSLIKMDIEGAEHDALLGAAKLISAHRPHLVLEQQPNDGRCLELLLGAGYQAIDLSSYTAIESSRGFPRNVGVCNVLFVHESRAAELPYAIPPQRERVTELAEDDFVTRDGSLVGRRLVLQPGRYLAELDYTASGKDNELMCGVRVDGRVTFRYHGYSKLLADSYRDWVFDVHRPGEIELYFEFVRRTSDPTFRVRGAMLSRLLGVVPRSGLSLLAP